MKPRAPFVVTAALAASSATACANTQSTINPPPVTSDSEITDAATNETSGDLDAPEGAADVSADAAEANPALCPSDDPGFGARKPCDAPIGVRCAYPDLCPTKPKSTDTNLYICHDDGTGKHWTLSSDPYTPPCPASQPKDGDPCPCTIHMAYAACNYGLCESMTRIYAACKGVDTFDPVWHVASIACNPPEPDGGLDADAATDATSDAGAESD